MQNFAQYLSGDFSFKHLPLTISELLRRLDNEVAIASQSCFVRHEQVP